MTLSVVIVDRAAGVVATGVESHFLAVGGTAAHHRGGVGVVMRQAMSSPAVGSLAFGLLEAGASALEVSDELSRDLRTNAHRGQWAIVDRHGSIASWTGPGCIQSAGHTVRSRWSCQANMAASADVWDAMSEALKNAVNLPAELRVLAALEAGQSVGGDIRGEQAVGIQVGSLSAPGPPVLDLRVDDHANPLRELRRLLDLHSASRMMREAMAVAREGDAAGAISLLDSAQDLCGDGNLEPLAWSVFVAEQHSNARASERRSRLERTAPHLLDFVAVLQHERSHTSDPS